MRGFDITLKTHIQKIGHIENVKKEEKINLGPCDTFSISDGHNDRNFNYGFKSHLFFKIGSV